MDPVIANNNQGMLATLLLLTRVALTVGSVLSGYDIGNSRNNNLFPAGSSGQYHRAFPWKRDLFTLPSQSPVDIITSRVKHIKFPPLYVIYNRNPNMVVEVENSGHGVSLTLPDADDKPVLKGSALPGIYIFENLHFHWGKSPYFGSEHFVDGESFSMEAHLVTYKSDYGSITEAMQHSDGIVVLTFFGKISTKDNPSLAGILSVIPLVREGRAKSEVFGSEKLLWFLDAVNKNQGYYAYPGSLTTEPFSEAVTFIIMPGPIDISCRQLEILRTLKDSHGQQCTTNRRELQPLFGRPIVYSPGIRSISAEQVNKIPDPFI